MFETVYGHTVVGPTNIRQESKTDKKVSDESVQSMLSHLFSLYPSLQSSKIEGLYAGLRPATEHQDYCIHADLTRGWVTLGGIR